MYWEQRLRNSDIAFPLKVKGSIEELVKTKYISINRKMDKKVLDRLTLKLKISTEEILLIVFSYTVLKYTKKEQVLINFPFSNRTKERQNRVGDYTKSIIYRCDIKRGVAFNEFCKAIQQLFQNGTIEQLCKVLGIEEHNGEKIDITDLQTAYLYGRKPEMILGGKGSRAYFSFEVEDVDIARLQKAIKNLVEEQEALRCTFHEDQYTYYVWQ